MSPRIPVFLLVPAVAIGAAVSAAAQHPRPDDLPARDAVVPVELEKKDEAALRERVMRWWTARVKRDHQTMYDLFEPAYKAKTSYAEFTPENTTRSRFDISDPEIVAIAPESQTRAKVTVQFKGTVSIVGQSFPSKAEETWVKVEDKWYKVHPPAITSILTPPSPQ